MPTIDNDEKSPDWREPDGPFGEAGAGDIEDITGTEDLTPEEPRVFERGRLNPLVEGQQESWSETFNTVADRLKWWIPAIIAVGITISVIEAVFEKFGMDPDLPTAAILWTCLIMAATAILLMLTRPRNVALTAAWAAAACLGASIAAVTIFSTIPTFLGTIPEKIVLETNENGVSRPVFTLQVERSADAAQQGDWAVRFALRIADYVPVVAGLWASVLIFGKATDMIRELNRDHGGNPKT